MQQTVTGTFSNEAAKTRYTKLDDQSVAQTTQTPHGTAVTEYHFVKNRPFVTLSFEQDGKQPITKTLAMSEYDPGSLSNAYMALRQLGGHPFGIGAEQPAQKKSWSLSALVPWGKKA